MTSKVGKRPLRSLSAHEKMDAIRRVHDGESKASVARDIGVPESTLRGWCKNEDKILYLSRQSTPETDDSEPRDKKQRFDAVSSSSVSSPGPFNLSVKVDSPTAVSAAAAAATADVPKTAEPPSREAALNLTKEQQQAVGGSPKHSSASNSGHAMSERERNRAELTRLSIELGLNRPEMFLPAQGGNPALADGLMAQWSSALTQAAASGAKGGKRPAPAAAHQQHHHQQQQPPPTHHQQQHQQQQRPGTKARPDQQQQLEQPQSVDDSVWYWLKTQQAMLGLVSSQGAVPPGGGGGGVVDPNSSWFWKWYKQFAYGGGQTAACPDTGTVLYQQLTREANSENVVAKPHADRPPKGAAAVAAAGPTKARAVLDNLLLNNNNNHLSSLAAAPNPAKKDRGVEGPEDALSPAEALEHGEKFLRWLECCSDPSVTAMQVLQFRYLLSNVRTCADRRSTSADPPRNRVRRK